MIFFAVGLDSPNQLEGADENDFGARAYSSRPERSKFAKQQCDANRFARRARTTAQRRARSDPSDHGARRVGAGPMRKAIFHGACRSVIPVVGERKQFGPPMSPPLRQNGIARVGGAIFELGSYRDVAEHRTTDAAGIDDQGSAGHLAHRLPMAVSAQHEPGAAGGSKARGQHVATRRDVAAVVE